MESQFDIKTDFADIIIFVAALNQLLLHCSLSSREVE